MLTNLKRKIKDDLIIAAILGACVLFVLIIFAGIAFEFLKFFAVVKYVFS